MGKNSFQMFKVKKAFEHGHQVLLVALQSRNSLIRRKDRISQEIRESEVVSTSSENDVSILAHLIRSDDEMLLNRYEEKKELIREWEAMQKRKERHLQSHRGEVLAGQHEGNEAVKSARKRRKTGGSK